MVPEVSMRFNPTVVRLKVDAVQDADQRDDAFQSHCGAIKRRTA